MSNGVRFVGKDPDGIAKAISVNDDGVLLVELLGSLLVGEVVENPTANTILGRMKSLESKIDTLDVVIDSILAKIIAAPSTEAKQDTIIGYVDGVEAVLANILAKIIASPATEAKQTALNALIGEVQTAPTANTLLARLKSLEDKIDAITDGTTPAVTTLSGSNIEDVQAIPTKIIKSQASFPGVLTSEMTYPEPARPKATTEAMGINSVIFAKDASVGDKGRLYSWDAHIRSSDSNGDGFSSIWIPPESVKANGIRSARRLSDGRILVAVVNAVSGYSLWASDLADDTTKTFSKVLDFQYGYPMQGWGWDVYTEDVLLVSEYMSTPEVTEGTNARFAYMSRDGGTTWTQIFEGSTNKLFHIHAIAYDPYHNIIFIATGDSTNKNVYYSYDWGQNWQTVWDSPNNDASAPQFITISAMPHCVLFGTDSTPNGIYRLNKNWRVGNYQVISPSDFELAYRVDTRASSLAQVFHSPVVHNGAHYVATWTAGASKTSSYIVGTKDGIHFYDLFVSQIFEGANYGVRSLFTDGTKLIGSWRDAPSVNRKIELALPTWSKI